MYSVSQPFKYKKKQWKAIYSHQIHAYNIFRVYHGQAYYKQWYEVCTVVLMISDGPMIDYNRKSVGLDSWTDDQSQS